MGRILREKRVGKEDSENFVAAKSGVLKTSEVLTVSKENTQKRSVLMDKTNALKQKNEAKQKIIAKAAILKDDQKISQKPKEAEEKLGKVTRRRRSSKENVKEPRKSPLGETNSKPLGDKTNNAFQRKKKLLREEVGTEIDETEDITCKDGKVASKEDSIILDEENIPNSVSLESPTKKRPSRNASKFEDGWIAALRRSRTSKERDAESQKPSPPKTKSKPAITSQIHETNAPEQNKRTLRGAKAGKTEDQAKPDIKTKENLISQNKTKRAKRDSSSKLQKSDTLSSESEVSSQASQDDKVDDSPRRKLPPRNAAKFEKGWISSYLRPRKSKENDGNIQKSPSKTVATPLKDQTNSHKKDGKAGAAEDAGEKDKTRLSSKLKMSEAVHSDSVDEKDLVSEQKVPGRPLGRGKNRLGSSSKDVIMKENDLESPQKPVAVPALESRPRGLKNFESRIAAKLGIDMSSDTKPKEKSPQKPSVVGTCSRRLRKRAVDKKMKTYADIEENEEVEENLSKQNRKSPVKPSTVSQKAKMRELDDIIANSAPTVSDDGAVDKSKGISSRAVQNDAVSSKSNPTDSSFEPKPGCSRDPDFTTPLRRDGSSKVDGTKKSPLVAPSSSLFSIFKKPEAPRRNSLENKIFVSGSKGAPAETTTKKQLPVYGNPNMTPLKKTSALPQEKKEELYEFEFDENEPKPKKKHKPIMKIQRMRAVKRKKPKVYEADPETERRVLRNLDLSPSVFEEFRSAKKKKVENAAGVVAAQPSTSAHPAEAAELHASETDATDDLGFDRDPMSSPCRDYGHSTPIRTDAPSMFLEDCKDKYGRLSAKVYSPVKSKDSPMRNEAPNMFMDDSRDKFGRLTAKVYSPVRSKDSPIPVLMAEYNNDPVRRDDSSRRSVVSNASCASAGNSIYHDDLDISASTPVKFNKNDSTYVRQKRKPLELNVSNCFGFDEPDIMEEPLVSPIKSTIHTPEQTAHFQPVPILKSKPPVMRPPPETVAVDVDQVIKQLRFEVGENSSADNSADISVYDDSEINLKNKSPIKRYFQPKDDHKHPKRKSPAKKTADGSNLDEGNDSFSPIKVAPKVPRLSYERLNKLRKKKVVEPDYKETSECEFAENSEGSDVEPETEPAEDIFKPTKNKYTAKKDAPKKKEKGMTKKEEEELEKWAQMFNSQCDQIDQIGLVVE